MSVRQSGGFPASRRGRIAVWALMMLAVWPARAQETAWSRMGAAARAEALASVADRPLEERLVALSAHFLGARYVLSPLGEGSGQDPDPLFHADAADCLTFVEQSLALAYSGSPDEVLPELTRLRYSDEGPSYASRLHLMEAQWIPTQRARGHLRDLTRSLGGADTLVEAQVLTPTTWTSRTSRALQLPKERQVEGHFDLEVIPLALARAQVDRFPHGSILMVVREPRPLIPTRITHLGIVVHRKGRTFLRHASRSGPGRVVDEDLATFLTRNAGYRKWPVVGVTVFEPQERSVRPSSPVATSEAPTTEAAPLPAGEETTPAVMASDAIH